MPVILPYRQLFADNVEQTLDVAGVGTISVTAQRTSISVTTISGRGVSLPHEQSFKYSTNEIVDVADYETIEVSVDMGTLTITPGDEEDD